MTIYIYSVTILIVTRKDGDTEVKINNALLRIAASEGKSVEEIRREIQTAIDEGLKNSDTEIQKHWAKIHKKGEKHTPEELIAYIVKESKKRMRF